jgi:hypothetical protein
MFKEDVELWSRQTHLVYRTPAGFNVSSRGFQPVGNRVEYLKRATGRSNRSKSFFGTSSVNGIRYMHPQKKLLAIFDLLIIIYVAITSVT